MWALEMTRLTRFLHPGLLSIAVLLIAVLPAFSDEPIANEEEAKTKSKVIDHWIQVSLKRARSYTISPADSDTQFKMLPKPVFKHTQVVRPPADDIGALYLWVDADTRPAVLGCVFCWSTSATTRMLSQEFYSLSDAPISTKINRSKLWNCKVPGTDWRPIPGAPEPKAKPRLRTLQMKQMAKQFSGFMLDRKEKRWQLRRVPKPLYEYQSKSDPNRAGALIAFCRATDVEAVLLLETREEKGKLCWQYTCGQFTDNQPHLLFGDKEIWSANGDPESADGKPHFLRMIGNRPKPQVEIDAAQTKLTLPPNEPCGP